MTNPYQTGDVICHKCGTFNKNTPTFCNKCGDPVAMQLKYDVNECQERGMTYSAPLKVTIRLTIYDKDPDTGAKTIREQLDKHRSNTACAACHAKIDPPGFALEGFDVIGGARTRYRSIGAGDPVRKTPSDPRRPANTRCCASASAVASSRRP